MILKNISNDTKSIVHRIGERERVCVCMRERENGIDEKIFTGEFIETYLSKYPPRPFVPMFSLKVIVTDSIDFLFQIGSHMGFEKRNRIIF